MTGCPLPTEGRILPEGRGDLPLHEALLYGDRLHTAKLAKRVACALHDLPGLRLRFRFRHGTEAALAADVRRDPTLFLDGTILLEGLPPTEEIVRIFQTHLKGIPMTPQTLPDCIVPKAMNEIRIGIEEFLELYNRGEAELVDIRIPEELRVWQLNFGRKIPAPELPAHLEELRNLGKLIVVACPHTDRSNMARAYLAGEGIDARYLDGGLLGLMARLKGGKAADLKLD